MAIRCGAFCGLSYSLCLMVPVIILFGEKRNWLLCFLGLWMVYCLSWMFALCFVVTSGPCSVIVDIPGNIFTSRKHAYIILTPLNPTFI